MYEEAVMAVSTGAASGVLSYLLQNQADALRTRISAIFRRGGNPQEEAAALQVLNEHAAALARHEINEHTITDAWTELLAAFLTAHPSARADIEKLKTTAPTNTVNIGSQHNHGSGAFIGNNHYGDININTRDDR
jgi:inactivated superfamily I helicase